MKKTTSILILAILLTIVFATGCGTPASKSDSGNPGAQSNGSPENAAPAFSAERNEKIVNAILNMGDMATDTDEPGNLIVTIDQPADIVLSALPEALDEIGSSNTAFENPQVGVYICQGTYDNGSKTIVVDVREEDGGTKVYISY